MPGLPHEVGTVLGCSSGLYTCYFHCLGHSLVSQELNKLFLITRHPSGHLTSGMFF